MPLSHQKLSVFYHQLAQQLGAGLTLAQALASPSPVPRAEAAVLSARAEAGDSAELIFSAAGPWLPAGDRPFLKAAAASGRLPLVAANLAARHGQLAATGRRIAMASIYPLFVFHFGAFVLPFLWMIDFEHGLQGGLPEYLRGLLTILVPVWGGAALFAWWVKEERPLALALLDLAPAVGGYRRHQALANFAFALGNLIEAGAPIGAAWRSAGEISGSRRIRVAAEWIQRQVELGRAPGSHLAEQGVFPQEFVVRYRTGETTGGLDRALLALAADHQDTANRRLQFATMLYPGLLFGVVAMMIGWMVIRFAMQYYGAINHMLDGM
ncbi:MAG: type II secretion system F family protein [Opitutaceae bacterium]|jgi:general secretion pathway protein F/type IV pilus assembly protein PilC|nr:type II secretion system F family protein [Opitutaceae bacterium]